jgi:hypothetical protein
MEKFYYVEAQYEPRGEGNGWELAPDDASATCFVVVARRNNDPLDEEVVSAGDGTRAEAQAFADAWNTHQEEPTP